MRPISSGRPASVLVSAALLFASITAAGAGAAGATAPSPRAAAVVIVVPPAQASAGTPFDVVVRVSGNPPSNGVPTGRVTVRDSAGHSCDTALTTAGRGVCSLTENASGRYALTATYSGDTVYDVATGNAVVEVRGSGRVRVDVAAHSPGTVRIGDPARFDVSVTALSPGGSLPTGSVQIVDAYTEVCVATLVAGRGSCRITPSIRGNVAVDAYYTGDEDYAPARGSTTIDVGTRPSRLSVDVDGPVTATAPVVLRFRVEDAARDVGLTAGGRVIVDVRRDLGGARSTSVGLCDAELDARGRATCRLTVRDAGSFELTAVYVGDEQFAADRLVRSLVVAAQLSTSATASFPGDGTLAATGAHSSGLLAVGLLALVVGLLLSAAGRPRHRH